MSKFLEYVKLLPSAIQNADKLVEGIATNTRLKNQTLAEDEIEEIIRRRVICAGCPFMSTNAKALGILKSDRTGEFCSACNCEIDWKTACLSCDCGLTAHNKRNPKNQLPLKWEAYDKNKIQKRSEEIGGNNTPTQP